MTKLKTGIIPLAVGAALTPSLAQATTYYVNAAAAPGGNGLGWTTAYKDLQQALGNPSLITGDQIWVAAGTYYPSVESCPSGGCASNPRNKTFRLMEGVKTYGGFVGTESDITQRNPELNETILDGRVDPNNPQLDVYHVVTAHEVGPTTMLNGFTITGGNANGQSGTVWYSNLGGGLLAAYYGASGPRYSNPQIVRCRFVGNRSAGGGAGAFVDWNNPPSSPAPAQFVNCVFFDNIGGGVGGAYVRGARADFTNCIFVNNFSGGLAVYCALDLAGIGACATPMARVTNCTFVDNGVLDPNDGSGGASAGGYPPDEAIFVENSIFWENQPEQLLYDDPNSLFDKIVVTYSDIQGSFTWPGTGNINADPLFCDEGAGILRLSDSSPCIDAGLDANVPIDLVDVNDNGDPNGPEILPWDLIRSKRRF